MSPGGVHLGRADFYHQLLPYLTLPYGFVIFRHSELWYSVLSNSWYCGLAKKKKQKTIRIRHGVFGMGPVRVQSRFEAVQRRCTKHLGREPIPVVHDSSGKGGTPSRPLEASERTKFPELKTVVHLDTNVFLNLCTGSGKIVQSIRESLICASYVQYGTLVLVERHHPQIEPLYQSIQIILH